MPRPKETILDEIVNVKGKRANLGRQLQTSKEANWLLAVYLNSFAKLDAGEPLTDVEKAVVDGFRQNGVSEAEVKEHGRLFTKMSAADKQKLFPGKFAQLTPKTKYEAADLKADLPKAEANLLKQPNAADVDVKAVHDGTKSLKDYAIPQDVKERYGSTLVRAVVKNPQAQRSTGQYTIKATQFLCNDETGPDWWGSDEPYWIFGTVSGSTNVTRKTQIFSDVDTGESRGFTGIDGFIWGQGGTPADFPEGEIGTLISLWEHDSGDTEKVRAGVAAAFAAASAILAATGVAAWISALVTGVASVVAWLLSS